MKLMSASSSFFVIKGMALSRGFGFKSYLALGLGLGLRLGLEHRGLLGLGLERERIVHVSFILCYEGNGVVSRVGLKIISRVRVRKMAKVLE
jgi:hypothetical protein